MAHQTPAEGQVSQFFRTGLTLAHHLPGGLIHGLIVQVLHQETAENAAQLLTAGALNRLRRQLQQAQVGLGREQLAGFRIERGSHHALQKEAGQMPSGRPINGAVDRDDATKGREAVGIKRPLERVGAAGSCRHTTGVGVLHDHRRWLKGIAASGLAAVTELAHRGEGGFEVEDVVVAELLALELLTSAQTRTGLGVPSGALVGILAVAQALAGRQLKAEAARTLSLQLGGQPLADRGVVLSGMAEGFKS